MSLLSGMLQEDPATWLSMAEILEHPWMKEEIASEEEVKEEMRNWKAQITGIQPDAEMP